MNRLDFIESISDIQYPEMLVNFFDQFIALKQLVEDNGLITVINNDEKSISFKISFKDSTIRDKALNDINTNCIVIYGKPISVQVNIASDTELVIILQ